VTRLIRNGDPAAGCEDAADRSERVRQIGPELDDVDGEHLVERLVERGQDIEPAEAKLDPSRGNRHAVPPSRLAQHGRGMIDPDDAPRRRAPRDPGDRQTRPVADLLSERRFGSFTRSVQLPATVDQDKVTAKFDKGVLTIALPKVESAKTRERKIEIKSA
jgi:hypothetical protein